MSAALLALLGAVVGGFLPKLLALFSARATPRNPGGARTCTAPLGARGS
jgi:hypothetical protein